MSSSRSVYHFKNTKHLCCIRSYSTTVLLFSVHSADALVLWPRAQHFSWFLCTLILIVRIVLYRSAPPQCHPPRRRSPRTATSSSGSPSSSLGNSFTRRPRPSLLSPHPSNPPFRPCRPFPPIHWRRLACSCGCRDTRRFCWRRGSTHSVFSDWYWASRTMEREVSKIKIPKELCMPQLIYFKFFW